MIFTVVLDESGSPTFPLNENTRYFSTGLLVPERPEELRDKIIKARQACMDERVRRRRFFHASEDGREAHRFLAQQLRGVKFHFQMLLADKRAAETFHKVNKSIQLHRILVRETLKYGIGMNCREIDLLVGQQLETLKTVDIIRQILDYHDTLQVLEAIRFPYGDTIRTKVNTVRMVSPAEEPLMDVVDYLIWAHQREELRDDEHGHLQLGASRSRTTVGGANQFPGIARILTCSTWFPKEPILSRKQFPFIEPRASSWVLPKTLTALQMSINEGQDNAFLFDAIDSGSKILSGDRSMDSFLRFGYALFEVIDTEGVILEITNDQFCILKKGCAICCWLRKKRMHRPPVNGWDRNLEEFLTLVAGQNARLTWS
jgi:hypothetical protein